MSVRFDKVFVMGGDPVRINEIILSITSKSVYFTNNELHQKCNLKSSTVIQLADSSRQTINTETLLKLQKVVELPVANTNFGELTTVDNFSSWFYHRYRIYYTLCELQYDVQKVIDNCSNTDKILVISNDKRHESLLKKRLNAEFINSSVSKKNSYNYAYLMKFALIGGTRAVSGLFKLKSIKKKSLLFIGAHQYYSEISGKGEKLLTHNYYGKIIFDKPSIDAGIIDYLRFPKLKGENPPLKFSSVLRRQPLSSIGSEFITLFYGFLKPSSRKLVKKRSKQLKCNYAHIQSLACDAVQKLMLDEYMKLHTSTQLFLYQFTAFERFFQRTETKLIVSIDENSANPKCIIEGARQNGIRSAGMQHGSIHKLHPSYMFTDFEEQFHPRTDMLYLWGEHFKNMLGQISSYKQEDCIVIGQPRMDYTFDSAFLKFDNSSDYLDSTKKQVMFASQPQQDESLRKRAAEDVIRATQNLSDLELVIKLHPSEKPEYYRSIADELGANPIILKNEVNLYFLLKNVDYVITCFSTVGAEAVFFNKPLIVLDHLKQDVMHYIQLGVGIDSHNEQELNNVLVELLKNSPKDFDHYKEYISSFAYKMDGNVHERFWQSVFDRI